ncbi:hypothetical protein COA17_18075 [Sphingomonas ginsenosidimutans]|uniref:Uncharacterized protein n=1 Tax=Sphingomonas ginsenosidimutans TaxID=862134 RepID=A0A2A4HSI5_9SPHN|nr:hypothetical protein [Sphingomonas ginsenosidimutans]PCG07486.1 hypothetical protein COA17_18075 [Sphingomonas ginsenosidimutans]
MVGTQALAAVIPDCLQSDPTDSLMPRIIGILGTFTLFQDANAMFLRQLDKDPLTLSESSISRGFKKFAC